MGNSTLPKPSFPALTGLRAVFILWVMFVHLSRKAVPGFLLSAHENWSFGVDGFFAISGFLVMRSLEQAYSKGMDGGSKAEVVKGYLSRRVSRIWPGYYITLLSLGMFACLIRGGLYFQLKQFSSIIPSFLLFYANYVLPPLHREVPLILKILWSISFQEQFYLLLLVLVAIPKENWRAVVLFSVASSIALRFLSLLIFDLNSGDHGNRMESWLILNLDAIGWGCLAWLHIRTLRVWLGTQTRMWVAGLSLLCVFVLSVTLRSYWPSDPARAVFCTFRAISLTGIVVLVSELDRLSFNAVEILNTKLFQFVGMISFEIYLTHIFVYSVLEKSFLKESHGLFLVALPCSVFTGWMMYRFVSAPANQSMRSLLEGRRELLGFLHVRVGSRSSM
ncbi:MAG: acyltransferase [Methylotenera sp.]|nr:acyltransferase [Oligoflexia bacterium]